jgi:hypothetical protein
MNIAISLFTIILLTYSCFGQTDSPPPVLTNCTEVFDHSYSLDELRDQFRDDNIRYNYTRAARVFFSHPNLTPDYLYSSLNHEDWQVRQLICKSIWDRAQKRRFDYTTQTYILESINEDYPITDDLIRVSIEGLRDDTTPYDRPRKRGLTYTNARFCTISLILVAHDWVSQLETAMRSDDHQQRYFAAYILARAGVAQSVDEASRILLPHLRDNDICADAKFSVYALGGFGEELKPILHQAIPTADNQQRDLLMLLLWNLQEPAITEQDRIKRSRFNSITKTVYDPSQEAHKDTWNMVDDFFR